MVAVQSKRRARKQPAEVRRETVLDAAIRVFARTSYHTTATAAIAREAGVSEPAIYRYFDSKRALYLAALERCGAIIRDEFAAIAARTESGADTLRAMGEWYEQMVVADPEYLRLRVRAVPDTEDTEVQAVLHAMFQQIHVIVRDVIRRGQEQGVYSRAVSAEAGAWLFIAIGQIADLTRLIGMEPSESLPICAMTAQAAMQALLADPASFRPHAAAAAHPGGADGL